MKNIYLFSGLGADERAFQLLDFTNYNITHITWIMPNDEETISRYATRILNQINTAQPILIGLSFGGMVAVEVAKQIKIEKVILISSAKNRYEVPWYFRAAGFLNLHKLLPLKLMKKTNPIANWFFGASNNFEKNLLKEILNDTDIHFLKWAINEIVKFKNETIVENLFHIHGANDKILPLRYVQPDFKVEAGGHFMVLNKVEEINEIIRSIINSTYVKS